MSSDGEYVYESDHGSGDEVKNELNNWDDFPTLSNTNIIIKENNIKRESSISSKTDSISVLSTTSSSRPKNYFCDYIGCNKAFTRPSLLTEHQLTVHQGIKAFECNRCDKSFARKTHLERHLLSHLSNQEKPFHCPVCGKGVITLQQLKRHEITHTKSFACPYENCSESFYKHPQLRSHILSVHLEKLVCKYCDRKFQRPYRLDSHIMKHHNPDVVTPYNCTFPECLRSFRTWTQLTLHVKNDHPKVQCHICKKFLVGELGLKMHMKIHDDTLVTRNWKCNICEDSIISFSKKTELIEHYKVVHEESSIPEVLKPGGHNIPDSGDSIMNKTEEDENDNKHSKKRKLNADAQDSDNLLVNIENQVNLDKYLSSEKKSNSAMNLLLNTIGRKLKCPYDKCYRTFKTEDKYNIHLEKHKVHLLKLKLLEDQEFQANGVKRYDA